MTGARKSLRELQRDLQLHLLNDDKAIAHEVLDAPPLPVAERLGIYRNAYQARLIEALDDTYTVLHELLGDEMFAALGEAYIGGHPSVHRSIRWYGGDLPQFLAENAPYREQPVLSEVALLEWTLAEVFDEADGGVIERSALAEIPAEDWGDLQFEYHASLRRLDLLWNAVPVWQAMSRDEAPPEPECGKTAVSWLLWRRNLKNYFRSLEPAEAAALDTALAGGCFAEICQVLSEWLPDDAIPPAAANYLAVWADSGIIASIG